MCPCCELGQVGPHPIDPLVVPIPNGLHEEYRRRPRMSPLTEEQKRRLGVRQAEEENKS
jgi:hypothetical protein